MIATLLSRKPQPEVPQLTHRQRVRLRGFLCGIGPDSCRYPTTRCAITDCEWWRDGECRHPALRQILRWE